jgi:broad specificity phosphatase PhoE
MADEWKWKGIALATAAVGTFTIAWFMLKQRAAEADTLKRGERREGESKPQEAAKKKPIRKWLSIRRRDQRGDHREGEGANQGDEEQKQDTEQEEQEKEQEKEPEEEHEEEQQQAECGEENQHGEEAEAEGVGAPATVPLAAAAPYFGVMRHSVRLDEDLSADWSDKQSRPYDCPIKDFGLPADQVSRLQAYGFTRIVCSPFRRCIQTAGVVAMGLGVREVTVHRGVGEVMNKVRNAINEAREGGEEGGAGSSSSSSSSGSSGGSGRDGDGDDGDGASQEGASSAPAYSLEYMGEGGTADEAGMVRAMEEVLAEYGVGLALPVEGERPSMEEEPSESLQRLMDALAELRTRYSDEPTLVVTHGDTVNAAGQLLLGQTTVLYDTMECCWVVFDPSSELVDSARCQILQLG